MLNSERSHIPKALRQELVSVQYMDKPCVFLGKRRESNMPATSTYFRSPYKDGIIRQLDVQFSNTVLYTATLKTSQELNQINELRGILRNSTNNQSKRHSVCVSPQGRRQESRKENHAPISKKLTRDRPGSWCEKSAKAKESKVLLSANRRPFSACPRPQSRNSYCVSCKLVQSSRTEKSLGFHRRKKVQIDDRFTPLEHLEIKNENEVSDLKNRGNIFNDSKHKLEFRNNSVRVLNSPSSISFSDQDDIESSSVTGSDFQDNDPPQKVVNCDYVDENNNDSMSDHINKSKLEQKEKESGNLPDQSEPELMKQTTNASTSIASGKPGKDSALGTSDESETFLSNGSATKNGIKQTEPYGQKSSKIGTPRTRVKSFNDEKRKLCLHLAEDNRRVIIEGSKSHSKTIENTEGGAIVTRSKSGSAFLSRMFPYQFQPLPEQLHVQSHDSHVNFCDAGKTDQILQWLRHMREMQSKEVESFHTEQANQDVIE